MWVKGPASGVDTAELAVMSRCCVLCREACFQVSSTSPPDKAFSRTAPDCVGMLQVVYWDQKALLLSYLKPDLPEGLYRWAAGVQPWCFRLQGLAA